MVELEHAIEDNFSYHYYGDGDEWKDLQIFCCYYCSVRKRDWDYEIFPIYEMQMLVKW